MKNLSPPNSPTPAGEINPIPPPPDRGESSTSCAWNFTLSAVVSSTGGSSDAIGVIEFDQTNHLFATGGIARKIRIYRLEKLINNTTATTTSFLDHDQASACEYYISTPARLSSLKWKPGSGSRLVGSGDYDGVVTEYDLEKRMPVFERDEHGGRRVWTIDYSHSDPGLGASGSDDGTMHVWDTRSTCGSSIAPVRPDRASSSPVCSVEFDPFSGQIVVVGCADSKIYGYDLRRTVDPVFILDGHQKAVTYARFLDPATVVSSSTDGCLMTWRVEDRQLIREYRGHVNSRRFVGLSAWRDGGLLSCGSEDNCVFVYDKRWGDPIWVRGFGRAAAMAGEGSFVSSVCWRQGGEERRSMLLAGGSDGVLQVYEGERSC